MSIQIVPVCTGNTSTCIKPLLFSLFVPFSCVFSVHTHTHNNTQQHTTHDITRQHTTHHSRQVSFAPTQERSETKASKIRRIWCLRTPLKEGAKKPELAKLLCENRGADVKWLMKVNARIRTHTHMCTCNRPLSCEWFEQVVISG